MFDATHGVNGLTAKPINVVALDPQRLAGAKMAYTARLVPPNVLVNLLSGQIRPRPGDLVLAQVIEVNYTKRIELRDGRRARLFVDDEVIVCYGNRYAPDVFEAVVSDDLMVCDLIAAGGIAGQVLSKAETVESATKLSPIGLLGNAEGRKVNLSEFRLHPIDLPKRMYTVAIFGTSMNSGKTTTAARLVRGMVAAGYKVGAAKVTGTGSGGDVWHVMDAGANPVFDFTYAGHASTYRLTHKDLEDILLTLTSQIQNSNVDLAVLEIADGLYQRETSLLLGSAILRSSVDGIIFTARDSAGASAGITILNHHGLPVLGISGILSSYPLLRKEAEDATGLPVITGEELEHPKLAPSIIGIQ